MDRATRERHGKKLTSVNWPASIDQYLDHLVGTVPGDHSRTSRTRLLAAIVSTTPADPAHLVERLRLFDALDLDELAASERQAPLLGRPVTVQR